jgi:YcaO-like protein with predicted kinase domain
MRNVDEKFKDSSPVETVNRIKGILNANGLQVQESWFENEVKNCYSLVATIQGTRFGTAGKGVTRELANASAHAELMERLQAGIMGREKLTYTDAKQMDLATLVEQCGSFFERISKVIEKFNQVKLAPEDLAQICLDYEGGKDTTSALPFYSVTEDKMTYVPESLLMPLFSSTGNCAGNTPEEAIVQGISEIVERWFQRHFLCLDVVPPTIPDDYLKNHARAWETITDIRSRGFDVLIKDCSMGSGYPVIAAVIIDKKKHAYHVHLGASPVFEIALGRSLTETFQGRVVRNVADTGLFESAKNDIGTYRKSFHVGRGAYPIEFFTENSSYPFVPFPDRTTMTNKDLLRYAVDFIKQRGAHLYVRDVSHMGFTAYKLIVPDMCKEDFELFISSLGVPRLIGDTFQAELDLQNATDDQLFEYQLLNYYRLNFYLIDNSPSCSKMMHLPAAEKGAMDRAAGWAHLAYTEWRCGNEKVAMDYAAKVQAQGAPGISDFCSCLLRAKKMLKQEENLDDVCSKLSLFYEADTVKEVRDVITDHRNPFEKYLVKCSREGGCDCCVYQKNCVVKAQKMLMNLVDGYVQNFDNEKAFDRIRAMFQAM